MEHDQDNPSQIEDVFKKITDRILSLLEEGKVPWHKPWKCSSFPINLYTKKAYRGINAILLFLAGYLSPYWLTERQAVRLGGKIRPGEIGMRFFFGAGSGHKRKAVPMWPMCNSGSYTKSITLLSVRESTIHGMETQRFTP